MSDQAYNGWKGFGDRHSAWCTWNAALWIDNDYGLYTDRLEQQARGEFGSAYKVAQWFGRLFPAGTPDMEAKDMDQINFAEILEHWEAE